MLDIKFVRDNPDAVRENIKKKFQDAKLPLVDEVLELDAKNRAAITEASDLRASRNTLSKQIGMLMGQAKKDPSKLEEAEKIKAQVKANADRLAELEALEEQYAARIHEIMLNIPNIIDPSVPIGPDDSCNVEVQRFGEPIVPDFDIPYHTEIMERFNGVDMDAAGRVSGNGFYYLMGNIARLPHVLIAGTTGSGKSVCTNSLIVSLLYKSTPEEVRFIMVDPKMVELAPYNGIPHLLIPVVTDPKKAAGALQWAVYEMMKRYKLFSENGVKDLAGFNALAGRSQELKKMPTVVVVIDELADLMLVAAKEVEESICRVAQMGRAAGMHLVIATQRPSSDVITGLMKANIPSRIAFAVASSLESRIILDTTGAEKLVGKGDMLYAPLGAGKPTRVQGCFITPEEIERVVDYVKQSGEAEYSQDVMDKIEQAVKEKEKGGGKSAGAPEPAGESPDDELLTAAVDVVLETGQASVSMLQRRLKLGYARAARLVDQMEERGYVGPFEGSKPRQLLIDKAKWQELKMAKAPAPEPEIDRNGSVRDVFESRDALD